MEVALSGLLLISYLEPSSEKQLSEAAALNKVGSGALSTRS